MKIEQLPDYPALQQLAASLWREGQGRGAAVLVGAGFSRNAELSGEDSALPPLWNDLQAAMAERLYGKGSRTNTWDPLRLAEEFRAYFGQAALTDLINELVPDLPWTPGRLHSALMGLPWSEVLTTNYDTLLERTPPGYQAVREPGDLARVRRPRIVKLHGSIGGARRPVIAEEDYRTYPDQSAAFVNLARQVFLENDLCLIGFGGDDPNFLQWSGWVRDRLGNDARRIYLVGVLALPPPKRRLLEARNVSPIDLAPLVQNMSSAEKHSRATALFLDYLKAAEPTSPWTWEPCGGEAYGFVPRREVVGGALTSLPVPSRDILRQVITVWQRDRETCPAWLVMPTDKREALRFATNHAPWPVWAALDQVDAETKATYLDELSWRHSVSFWPMEEEFAKRLEALVEQGPLPSLDRARLALIAVRLLRHARLSRDWQRFARVDAFLKDLVETGSEVAAEIEWQNLLGMRDRWEFTGLAERTRGLGGDDPVWRLRQASLLAELGETARAREVASQVMADLDRRQERDARSIWVLTRRAWGTVLARAIRMSIDGRWNPVQPIPEALAASYDVEEELDQLRRDVVRERERRSGGRREVEATFRPGGLRDNSTTVNLTGMGVVTAHDGLRCLSDVAGLPLRMPGVDLLTSTAAEAADLAREPTLGWALNFLYVTKYNDDRLLERHFSRDALACMPAEIAGDLIKRLRETVAFWEPGATAEGGGGIFSYAETQLKKAMEALSRILVRADQATTKAVFAWACQLATRLGRRHYTLFEQLDGVLVSCIDVSSRRTATTMVLECLRFPLPPDDAPSPIPWPNPIIRLWSRDVPPGRVSGDAEWDFRITTLVQALGRQGRARGHAAARLAYLCTKGVLSAEEARAFGDGMWARVDAALGDLPADLDLFLHHLSDLPMPEEAKQHFNLRTALFADLHVDDGSSKVEQSLAEVVAAASLPRDERVLPSREQALRLFESASRLFADAPDRRKDIMFAIRERRLRLLGQVLGLSVVPALADEDLTDSLVSLLQTASAPEYRGAALSGLVEVAWRRPETMPNAVASLRRGLARGDHFHSLEACRAVSNWMERSADASTTPQLPSQVVSALLGSVNAGLVPGLQPKLWCARKLLDRGALTAEQEQGVEDTLDYLANDLTYVYPERDSSGIVGLSIARAECVRLAMALKARGSFAQAVEHWLETAKNDPLPEVRHALSSNNDEE